MLIRESEFLREFLFFSDLKHGYAMQGRVSASSVGNKAAQRNSRRSRFRLLSTRITDTYLDWLAPTVNKFLLLAREVLFNPANADIF